MQGELTSRLSSSWMYIAYTHFFYLWQEEYDLCVCTPLLMNWQKGEEKFRVLYALKEFYMHWNLEFLMHWNIGVFICMFILFVTFYYWYQDWYQEYLLFVGIKGIFCCIFWLVSRACLFHWYQISYYVYLCWAFMIYLYCLLLCMS